MKTIFILILINLIQSTNFAQTKSSIKTCAPIYATDGKNLVFTSSLSNPCYTILIDNLPLSQSSTILELNLSVKGSYTFKKSEALVIPPNYMVVLEDLYTGNSFNLGSPEKHSFSIGRASYKKFALRIYKIKDTLEVAAR